MHILLPESILKIQARESLENSMKLDLLVLLVSKPVKFVDDIPQDWSHCAHVDLLPAVDPETGAKADWLDPDTQIRPALETLVSHLVHLGRSPVDICAVKKDSMFSIVIKTTEPQVAAA